MLSIDSDKALQLKRYYDIKYEPEAVICFYGDEVVRHVGVNYDNLRSKLDKVIRLEKEANFGILPKWVPFGTGNNVYFDTILREALRHTRQ